MILTTPAGIALTILGVLAVAWWLRRTAKANDHRRAVKAHLQLATTDPAPRRDCASYVYRCVSCRGRIVVESHSIADILAAVTTKRCANCSPTQSDRRAS